MLREIPKADTVRGIKHRLLAIYHTAIAAMEDSYDTTAGATLNLMYFQECVESVVSSED